MNTKKYRKADANMKRWSGRVMLIGVIFIITATGSAENWRSAYGHDHPLTGRIWDTRAATWISEADWLGELVDEDIVLLGEMHSNEDHHLLQAKVLQAFYAAQRQPKLVFEMFPYDVDQNALNAWTNFDQLLDNVNRFGPHWPWKKYRPLLDVIDEQRQIMRGSNLNKAELNRAREPNSELLRAGKQWSIEQAINPTQRWQMGEVIREAHCGHVTQDRLPGAINIQIARDLSFALTLAQQLKEAQTAIMIVGAGHVRKDFGIPYHLRRLGLASTSVRFAPVIEGLTEVADYTSVSGARMVDYVVFTANSQAQDPCIEFAQQLKKLRMKEK